MLKIAQSCSQCYLVSSESNLHVPQIVVGYYSFAPCCDFIISYLKCPQVAQHHAEDNVRSIELLFKIWQKSEKRCKHTPRKCLDITIHNVEMKLVHLL